METKTLGQKLVLYGIGAGAASMAGSANAEIIYSGPWEFSGNDIFFDLQNTVPPSATSDPNDDFSLASKTTKGGKAGIYQLNGSAMVYQNRLGPMGASHSYALRLAGGTTIGGASAFTSSYSYLQNHYVGGAVGPGYGLGDWNPGDRGFIGLRILVGADTFYGWADVTLNNLDGSGPGVFTLHGYAYENVAGTDIVAGAIPEPSAIALLVAGAVGVAALKRRKK